ncbi:MAG TPA: uroporphyrinogen decarboxylase family protein [bacterium]|nr:uroporphyrinogen decarboxylase family protein [bacterium]HOX85813.1 uroporphyrinogen decarboxylase family protein [bacterium]HPG45204.1 uroporphyrinogen decarboxylase family protein [bacterium]HPM97446.1 uroporphyrinogen decarboxylase family protein [bacterium]
MAKNFSSKERCLTAFSHQQPDRVPIDYLYNPAIDRRLKAHFGLQSNDNERLRQALGVDFRAIEAPYIGPKLHADSSNIQVDNWGRRKKWVEHEWGGYWDYCDWPLQSADLETIRRWPLPSPDDFDYQTIRRDSRKYEEYCVVVGHPGVPDIINSNSMLRTMEQVLVDLITDDPAGLELIDRSAQIWLEIMRRTLEAGEGRIDLLWLGEDLGTQRGPVISLDLYRKHIRPRHQKFVDLAREYQIATMIHSCGSSSWAFDDFVEMGIAVVDTLQPEAKNMQPAELKKRWGDKLCFHGMISTAGPLAYGTPAEVAADVRTTLDIMMPNGGYALAPTHDIQDNSPTENVVMMYKTAQEYGVYR